MNQSGKMFSLGNFLCTDVLCVVNWTKAKHVHQPIPCVHVVVGYEFLTLQCLTPNALGEWKYVHIIHTLGSKV